MEPKGFLNALFDYSFTAFVTPKIIKVLYVLATIGVALSTLALILAGFNGSTGAGLFMLVIGGPLFFLLGMIYARVLLELVIIFFRINGNVQEIRDGRTGGAGPPSGDALVVAPAGPVAAAAPAPEPPAALEAESSPEPEAAATTTCEHCGAERRPGTQFCPSCGKA